jgi:hypothetical protein
MSIKKIIFTSVLVLVCNKSFAESIVFYDFSDLTNIQLNGQAATLNPNSNNVLSLTDDLGQSSSAFFKDTISLENLASFSAAFEFQITDPQGIYDNDGQGADGLTFVVQADSVNVGGSGGSMGYGGIDNSIAIEFDTWNNRRIDNNDGNHIGINSNGSVDSIIQTTIDTRMNNGAVWTAWVDYDGFKELLEVRIAEDGTRPEDAVVSTNIDLSATLGTPDAYIGFTSGTGGAAGDHDILSMIFHDDYNPITAISIPEPNSFILFFISVALLLFFKKT